MIHKRTREAPVSGTGTGNGNGAFQTVGRAEQAENGSTARNLRKNSVRSFLTGVLVTLLAVGLVVPTAAQLSGRDVTIYPGVAVYMNDRRMNPTDESGNPVDTFIYNGTTYLPVRAVSQAFQTAIEWDGETSSVYIGRHLSEQPTTWVDSLDYFDMDGKWRNTGTASERDNLGIEHTHCIGGDSSKAFKTSQFKLLKLNGQYALLTGTLFQQYDNRTKDGRTTLSLYGDGERLWSGSVARAEDPVPFEVYVNGVLELKIVVEVTEGSNGYGTIGDFALWN